MSNFTSNINKCRIIGCTKSNKHTTYYHRCICGKFGHGEHECLNHNLIDNLKNYWHEILPEEHWCTVSHCRHKKYHTKEEHYCSSCGRQGHEYSYNNPSLYDPLKKCLVQSLEENIRRIGINNSGPFLGLVDYNNFFSIYNTVYITDILWGVRILYIRKKLNRIETLLLQLDSNNDLADPLDETIKNKFIEHLFCIDDYFNEYLLIETNETNEDKIKCPVCRYINDINDCSEIKGLSEKCKVCYVNNIEILFTACKHACICKECFSRI